MRHQLVDHVLPAMTSSSLGLFDSDLAAVDHGRRRFVASLKIVATIVDQTQKPRIGWMVDMHDPLPVSSFGKLGQFCCSVRHRITGYCRATPRPCDGLKRRSLS